MVRSLFLSRALLAALLLAAPAPLLAVPAAVEAQGEAIILKPLALLKIEDMDFGVLFPSTAATTAILDSVTGAVTVSGGVVAGPQPTNAAKFMGAGAHP